MIIRASELAESTGLTMTVLARELAWGRMRGGVDAVISMLKLAGATAVSNAAITLGNQVGPVASVGCAVRARSRLPKTIPSRY
jgi:hypothetical protein